MSLSAIFCCLSVKAYGNNKPRQALSSSRQPETATTMSHPDPEGHYGFQVADYVVCGVVISTSIGIGLYYALSGGKQSTTLEYHLGNRNLNVIPVMLSLMVTSQSSILLIGVPAEVYLYGIMGMFGAFGFAFSYLIASRIVVPLVYPMKITSVNEVCKYFSRFNYFSYYTRSTDLQITLNMIMYHPLALKSMHADIWVLLLYWCLCTCIYILLLLMNPMLDFICMSFAKLFFTTFFENL